MWLGCGGVCYSLTCSKICLVKLYKVLTTSNKVVSALLILLVKFYYLLDKYKSCRASLLTRARLRISDQVNKALAGISGRCFFFGSIGSI